MEPNAKMVGRRWYRIAGDSYYFIYMRIIFPWERNQIEFAPPRKFSPSFPAAD